MCVRKAAGVFLSKHALFVREKGRSMIHIYDTSISCHIIYLFGGYRIYIESTASLSLEAIEFLDSVDYSVYIESS